MVLYTESLQRAHLINLVTSVLIAIWTVKAMIPGNETLMTKPQLPESDVDRLLRNWGKKHAVRTVLSSVTMAALLTAQLGLM